MTSSANTRKSTSTHANVIQFHANMTAASGAQPPSSAEQLGTPPNTGERTRTTESSCERASVRRQSGDSHTTVILRFSPKVVFQSRGILVSLETCPPSPRLQSGWGHRLPPSPACRFWPFRRARSLKNHCKQRERKFYAEAHSERTFPLVGQKKNRLFLRRPSPVSRLPDPYKGLLHFQTMMTIFGINRLQNVKCE